MSTKPFDIRLDVLKPTIYVACSSIKRCETFFHNENSYRDKMLPLTLNSLSGQRLNVNNQSVAILVTDITVNPVQSKYKKKTQNSLISKVEIEYEKKKCLKTINLKCEAYFENNVKLNFDLFNVTRIRIIVEFKCVPTTVFLLSTHNGFLDSYELQAMMRNVKYLESKFQI